jgi:hypothetical protein
MKDFPLNDLLSATDLDKIRDSLYVISSSPSTDNHSGLHPPVSMASFNPVSAIKLIVA